MDEFGLIARYFEPLGGAGEDVVRGIGDDGAVIAPSPGRQLVVAVDTLVEGRHFPADLPARAIGFRAVQVNLSDLAAMAAIPRFATLALTLPRVDEAWLTAFAAGFGSALTGARCVLIGGDTTRGPLTITIQLIGLLEGPALMRDAARAGDIVMVSGTLGDARAALDVMRGNVDDVHTRYLLDRYRRPQARLGLAQSLREYAHAAIDISDGLVADLGHIATASDVAIDIDLDALPLSPALTQYCVSAVARNYAATGGDDYELAFTIPPDQRDRALSAAAACGVQLTVIGRVKAGCGVHCFAGDGSEFSLERSGYRHFE